jgi:UDP-2,3-diacylglucosamine pyrophosphatase LpxH
MKVRSIFVSDVHLGTRPARPSACWSSSASTSREYLYLVGDIVDFWAMRRGVHWTPAQNTVVQKILRRARHGEQVMLIPGNHDEALREYDGVSFGSIRRAPGARPRVTADGRRFLLLHGDEFDQVTRHHRWVAIARRRRLRCARARQRAAVARLRRLLRRPGYWSLAGYAKSKVKRAVSFIFDFEDSVIHAVRARVSMA